MKVLGKRKLANGSIQAADNLQKLAIALRGNKPFHPRGIFRFKSFEEKNTWAKKIMSR